MKKEQLPSSIRKDDRGFQNEILVSVKTERKSVETEELVTIGTVTNQEFRLWVPWRQSCDLVTPAPGTVARLSWRLRKIVFIEWVDGPCTCSHQSRILFNTRNIIFDNSLSLLTSLFAITGAVVLLKQLQLVSVYAGLSGAVTGTSAPHPPPLPRALLPTCQPSGIIARGVHNNPPACVTPQPMKSDLGGWDPRTRTF